MYKLRIIFLAIFLFLFVAFSSVVYASDVNDTILMDVSVPFIENQGQTDQSVSYYADTFYGTSYITNDGITHEIHGENNKSLVIKEEFLDKNGEKITFNSKGEEKSTGRISYLKGNESSKWNIGLNSYKIINLGELYPGITVKLKANSANIEKLFYIKPGANPDNINIQVLGADKITIDKNGYLNIISNGFKNVSLTKPIAYQNNKEINTNYIVNEKTYKFKVDQYDTNQELIIDPELQYSTYLGGIGKDIGEGIAVDNEGNIYITGYTSSNDFPLSPGAYQNQSKGGFDVFVTKLNSNGADIVYSTYIGGGGSDSGRGIAVDSVGNAYITGITNSGDFPVSSDAYQNQSKGGFDVFVTKLNSNGTDIVYSTYLGGVGYNYVDAIAVDSEGNVYVTGRTDSGDFPVSSDAYQNQSKGGFDGFVTKLNSNGSDIVYSTYIGGGGSDSGRGIAVDSVGNAYITGYTNSGDFPVSSDAYQNQSKGGFDGFVTKLNSNGSDIVYSTYIGGISGDSGYGIAVDSVGNAYITGDTNSGDFPVSSDAYKKINKGGFDVFVTKLNSNGSDIVYSTYIGGTMDDSGRGIAVDSVGNAYITGDTYSSNFPVSSDAYQNQKKGIIDSFVVKLLMSSTANVTITNTANGSLNVGEIGEFIITLENKGPNKATDVIISNSNIPTGWNVTASIGTWNNINKKWFIDTLNKSATATLTIKGTITPEMANTTITNIASETQNEYNQETQTATASIIINPLANVKITNNPTNTPLNVGEIGEFIITLENKGPNKATDVIISNSNIPTGWNVTASIGTWNNINKKWFINTLNKSVTATLTIKGTITPEMANTTITNIASETQNEYNQETQTATASIIINPIKTTTIKGNNLQIHYKNGTRYEITLTNYKGEPINEQNIIFNIYGTNITRTTNNQGKASIGINFNPGNYQVTAEYKGNNNYNPATTTNNITVLTTITGKNITKIYKNNTQYTATFLNEKGNPLKETMVEFNIYGVFYKRKTDENGIAQLNINLNPGEYIITAKNPINNQTYSNTINVLPKLIGENLEMKYKDGSQYKVKLLNKIGNPIKDASIKFNIYGVFYTRTTDSQGIARLNINLMPGKYIVTAYYGDSATSNTITVKRV